MKTIKISLYLLLIIAFCFSIPTKAKVSCPESFVILKGTAPTPFGGTYSEHVEMKKISGGPGYNGTWQITKFQSITTYSMPSNISIDVPPKPQDFQYGMTMNCGGHVDGNKAIATCTGGNLHLDVRNNKIGYIKTGIWVGQIQGKNASLKFHKEHPYEPIIKGVINDVPGGELDLKIIKPTDKKFVFSNANPGTLELTLKAKVTPSNLKSKIKWNIPKIQGSQRILTPANGMGETVTVKYKGLPTQNSSFGYKDISANVDTGLCEVSDTKEVAIYFPRDAKNNPNGSVPNWFYYWSQTAARKGPIKFGGLTGLCAGSVTNKRDGLIGYYRFTQRDSVYYVCDLKRLPGDFQFLATQIKSLNPLQLDSITTTGIDTFAIASHHENGHYEHFKDWWFQFNPNPISPTGQHMMHSYDSDGDFIPNTEETARSLDPNNKYTLQQFDPSIQMDDEEYLAMLAEAMWNVGNADHVDWAKPGKQWQ